MICLQCGTSNDNAAKFCSSCGFALSQAQQPSRPASSPVPGYSSASTGNALNIIGIVAAGIMALGFFLPWFNTRRYRGFDYDGEGIPAINGIYILKKILGSDMNGEAIVLIVLLVVLLISIPAFSIVYIIQKLKSNAVSVKLQTLSASMAGFLPLLLATILLFLGSSTGYIMMFGGANLGIGAIFMIIGAVFLFGEVLYLIMQKNDSKTLARAWAKAAIAGIITAALHYGMIEIAKSSNNENGMLNIYTLFTMAVLAIGFNVAVNIHKSQDLGGKLSFVRCIGFSLIYGLVTGIGCYLVLLTQVPGSEQIPGGSIMVLVALNTLFSFIFGAFRALSLPDIKNRDAMPEPLDNEFLGNS